jgi:hypothetical protein
MTNRLTSDPAHSPFEKRIPFRVWLGLNILQIGDGLLGI